MKRLALIASHPVQYYAPWFRQVAAAGVDLRVFYLWDFGSSPRYDPGFARTLQWDIPLLEGYAHEFIPNTSPDPGTHHFRGLQNPGLLPRIRSWKPDAVLTLGFAWQSLLNFVLRWNSPSCPLLLRGDSHDLARPVGLRSYLSRLATRMIFSRYRAFLACSLTNREYFLRRGVHPDQVFSCPHAIDMERFHRTPVHEEAARHLRQEWSIPEGNRVILFAGKMEPKKQPLLLLRAFQELSPPQTSLVFVGSGPLDTELHQRTGGDPRVRLVPFANQSHMPAVYCAADLFVLPSLGPSETWGLAVQEALACRTPVLISDHVGCHQDLVHPDRNGAIFKAGDPAALAAALRHALHPEVLGRWQAQTRSSLDQHTYAESTRGLLLALESCG